MQVAEFFNGVHNYAEAGKFYGLAGEYETVSGECERRKSQSGGRRLGAQSAAQGGKRWRWWRRRQQRRRRDRSLDSNRRDGAIGKFDARRSARPLSDGRDGRRAEGEGGELRVPR